MLQAEQILQQRYQLKQQLGNNPSRQTWLALDLVAEPQQSVIVKLLPFSPQTHWDDLKLFEREAQVLKHLNHPRIPRYRDYFSVEKEAGGGLPWFGLVQDYISGSSLQQRLKNGQRFTQAEAKYIAIQLLNILIYLHELSPPVLHRDIKPSNIIWTDKGQVYLVDFGAVQERAKAEGVTFTVVGTGGYAPPEQLWGRAVPGSDLYALGATLIHLLTGISPANLPQHRMRLQFRDKVNLTPSFAQWIEKLTDPAPERRFSQARQSLSALKAVDNSSNTEGTARKARYGRIGGLALVQYAAISVCAIAIPAFAAYRYIYEGKYNTGAMNRAQQAYFLEYMEFTDSFPDLGVGISNSSHNYDYSIRVTPLGVFNYATPRNHNLKGYVGGVFLASSDDLGIDDTVTIAIACETYSPGMARPAEPVVRGNAIECGFNTTPVGSLKPIVLGKDSALAYNSLNEAAAGRYDQALKAIQTIKNDSFKDLALVAIANELAVAGRYNQALRIAETIKLHPEKAKALAKIAHRLTVAGKAEQANRTFAQALSVAEKVGADYNKSSTLRAIANELASAGRYDQALNVAATIKDGYIKQRLIEAIVRTRPSPAR